MSNAPAISGVEWTKSSYSGGTGGNCVEVARSLVLLSGAVPIRDSKAGGGPALSMPTGAWSTFVTGVRGGVRGA
ncbi:DUF397 domain-containing protein [Streptomyces griseocarneus]|nr:DUF397 domain-containing protein [Streptomyces griseocarneus]